MTPCDAFVYGPVETGKTHWACAHANHWRKRVVFITASGAIIRYQAAMTGKDEMTASGWLDHLIAAELLILDDFGASNPDDRSMAFLLEVLSSRESWQRPTIVTSNIKLSQLDARFQSRLGGYRVVSITGASRRIARGGEIREAEPETPEVPSFSAHVDYWLSLSHAERQSLVDRAKANDPDYWRSYKVPGRCVAPQDQNDRNDCTRFGSCIAQIMLTAQVTG